MKKLLKNPVVKNILSALAVAIFGFILLNLTFLFDALFQSLIDGIVRIFTPVDFNMSWQWFPPIKHAMFVVVILLISWFVFRSKLKVLYKAIYMTVPVAVVLATVGIFLYQWQIVSYSVGSLLCIGTLYYFYRTKQPWLYYYAVVLVGLALAIFTLTGGEI
jgi:cation transport ATPase